MVYVVLWVRTLDALNPDDFGVILLDSEAWETQSVKDYSSLLGSAKMKCYNLNRAGPPETAPPVMWLSLLGWTKTVHDGSKIRPVFRLITDLLCWITRASRTPLLLAFSLMPLMYGRNTKQTTSNLTLHPFCPIVFSIHTLTYRLAKHLAAYVLQSLVGTTNSYVRDSRDFVTKLEAIDAEIKTWWWSLILSASSREFQSVKPFGWLKICLRMMTPWRPRQTYCQLTLCLLPDCGSPQPTSSLEVTSISKWKVWPWVPRHQSWTTSKCRTLGRGHWQQPSTGFLSIWMVDAQKSSSLWRRRLKDHFLFSTSMWKRMEASVSRKPTHITTSTTVHTTI